MTKTIIIFGYGPGISSGVAEKFGSEGLNIALVGRTQERLDSGVARLAAKGISAKAFVGDAADPASVSAVTDAVKAAFGTISALHWNAYGVAAGDLVTASSAEIGSIFDVAIKGLLASVQAALPDLRDGRGAVLLTNGAFGDLDPQLDQYAAATNNMGLALANAAKHKLVGLLSAKLAADGIYVGEVMIAGSIKGTPWGGDNPDAIEPSVVGDAFYRLYTERTETYARLS